MSNVLHTKPNYHVGLLLAFGAIAGAVSGLITNNLAGAILIGIALGVVCGLIVRSITVRRLQHHN